MVATCNLQATWRAGSIGEARLTGGAEGHLSRDGEGELDGGHDEHTLSNFPNLHFLGSWVGQQKGRSAKQEGGKLCPCVLFPFVLVSLCPRVLFQMR